MDLVEPDDEVPDEDVVVVVVAWLLEPAAEVVAVLEVEPTAARSSDVAVEPVELVVAVEPELVVAPVVAGVVSASAVVPPTTLTIAADAATMRDRRVRLHRRRVAGLISGRLMVRSCAVVVGRSSGPC